MNKTFQDYEKEGRAIFTEFVQDIAGNTDSLFFTEGEYDPYDATYCGWQTEIKYQQGKDSTRDHTLIPAPKADIMLQTSSKNMLVTILDSGNTIYINYFSDTPEHMCYINYTPTTCGDDKEKHDKASYYFNKNESVCYRKVGDKWCKSDYRPNFKYHGPTYPVENFVS